MQGRKLLSRLCIVLGVLCIGGAAGLGIRNQQEDARAQQQAGQVLAQLQQDASGSTHTAPVILPEETVPSMRTVSINGYDYIGYLTFPTLDTKLPVMDHWSKAGLKIAPGRYCGSVYTGDLVIAGHNYAKGFGKLKALRQGAPVLIWPAFVATAMSAIVVSSVSPER